ncbi:MAG: hypothetical protein LBC82_01165 [Oscillospiraceae bacterium]|jgi:hypothetical protein|nr:hypothetical protein [Oscillospiraceae bacterium]
MLSTPKKAAGKGEKVLSDTASFKKVAYGFSPEEVNLYLHSLRKKNMELQAEVDTLSASINPDSAIKMENLERHLSEANERYLKEKELTTMLETECTRLGEEFDKLTNQLSETGSTSEQAKAKIAEAEANAKKAEISAAKAEAKVVDAEAKAADAVSQLAELEARYADAKEKLDVAREEIVDYSNRLEIAETNAALFSEKAEQAERQASIAENNAALFSEKAEQAEQQALMAEQAVKTAKVEKAKPAAANAEITPPPAAREVDLNFAEFQFEEAPAAPESDTAMLADTLSTVLAEIGDLKSQLAKAKEAEEAAIEEDTLDRRKTKKQKRAEESEENARLSRAELKIQIFQEEAEDSYIIPEKYLKMIEDIEEQDDEDDFSYLLTDASPSDDMAISHDDDDMDNLLVSVPIAAAPPGRTQQAKKPAVSSVSPHDSEQYTRTAKTKRDPVTSAAGALMKADVVEEDSDFVDLLNLDFKKAEPKGENLVPKNPAHKEKGADLRAGNPHYREKGPDLDEDLFNMVVGEAANPNKNVRARTNTGSGFDFLLESDDSEII